MATVQLLEVIVSLRLCHNGKMCVIQTVSQSLKMTICHSEGAERPKNLVGNEKTRSFANAQDDIMTQSDCERSEAIFNPDIVGRKIATVAFGDLAMDTFVRMFLNVELLPVMRKNGKING
mgnify:FL=1